MGRFEWVEDGMGHHDCGGSAGGPDVRRNPRRECHRRGDGYCQRGNGGHHCVLRASGPCDCRGHVCTAEANEAAAVMYRPPCSFATIAVALPTPRPSVAMRTNAAAPPRCLVWVMF